MEQDSELNENALFWFDKELIEKFLKQDDPVKSALGVFPILASFCGKSGSIEITQKTIGKYLSKAKHSRPSVKCGIEELDELISDFKITKTKNGGNRYHVPLIPKASSKVFPFYRSIIDSGIWAKLTPSAKVLYLAMRSHAYFDLDEYQIAADFENYVEDGTWQENYKSRKFEFLRMSKSQLGAISGLTRPSVYDSLEYLEENGLIVWNPDQENWRVYLKI